MTKKTRERSRTRIAPPESRWRLSRVQQPPGGPTPGLGRLLTPPTACTFPSPSTPPTAIGGPRPPLLSPFWRAESRPAPPVARQRARRCIKLVGAQVWTDICATWRHTFVRRPRGRRIRSSSSAMNPRNPVLGSRTRPTVPSATMDEQPHSPRHSHHSSSSHVGEKGSLHSSWAPSCFPPFPLFCFFFSPVPGPSGPSTVAWPHVRRSIRLNQQGPRLP